MNSKKKVIVLNPPSSYVPAEGWEKIASAPLEGAVIASTVLAEINKNSSGDFKYDVQCYDLRRLKKEDLEYKGKKILNEKDAVAICLAGSPESFEFIADFSAKNDTLNKIPIVLGGPLATISWKTILQNTKVHYCLLGECEFTLPELIMRIENSKAKDDLPVAVLDFNGKPIKLQEPKRIEDLRIVPKPNYQLWEKFDEQFPKVVCYSTQRGCPYSCRFCANQALWGKPGKKCIKNLPIPIENIKRDITYFAENNVDLVYLNDPTFNYDHYHSLLVAQVFGEHHLRWACMIRAERRTETDLNDFFQIISRNGCQAVFMGIESVNPDIVREQKNENADWLQRVEQYIEYAESYGVELEGFFILGIPGETKKSIEDTKEFVNRHKFKPRAKYFVPYPGTEVFENISKNQSQFELQVLKKMSLMKWNGFDDLVDIPETLRSKTLDNDIKEAMAEMNNIEATNRSLIRH